ncbi:MAG: HAD family hydrolase [Calditrichaeota bacterium]|nr:HAD family hydrolase [Calditrichota bacterium]
MIEAVLFDLDGTLILFNETEFFKAYSGKLYLSFRDILPSDDFVKRLMYATQKMTDNDGRQNNAAVFVEYFKDGLNISVESLWQRFENFYTNEFHQFQPLMKPADGAREVVEFMKEKNLKLVIATNPMFPLNVQLMRLDWAGLSDIEFDLITHVENFSFCKPKLEYYQSISDKIGVPAENCLMVGNDPFNDMIASKIGMETYLTTDSAHISIELSRELAKNDKLELPTPDYKGLLKDVPELDIFPET